MTAVLQIAGALVGSVILGELAFRLFFGKYR